VPTPEARAGGGSGEIAVRWRSVPSATGYRVKRSSAPGGPFEVSADIDMESGRTTLGDGVTNVWMPAHDVFEYVELISDGSAVRYVRVIAYNENGEGPASAVICAAPPGAPRC
jgi:hypothetical protein